MRLSRKAALVLLALGLVSGCSVRGQDLSKESFQGTIHYAAARSERPATSPGSDSNSTDAPAVQR
jgi:hypothetical protein